MLRALLVFLLSGPAGIASADMIPECGPGTHRVMNPTPPGAMHHGGGHCEPDDPPALPTEPTATPEPTAVVPPEAPPAPPAPTVTATATEPSAPAPAAAPAPSAGMCSASPASSSALTTLGTLLVIACVPSARRRAA